MMFGFLPAQDLDDLIDGTGKTPKKESSLLDDLIEGKTKGYPVRLVQFGAPEKAIDDRLFWRTYKGLVTASAIPDEFSVDGEPIMQTTVGQKRLLEGPLPILKPTTGFAKLEKRVHILNPGRIKIHAPGGNPETDHPAVLLDKTPQATTLRIQLAPVIFESLTEDGQPVSFHPEIICAEKPLLSKSLRFRKLTLWLPIGLTYESSFGRFRLETDGTIRYAEEEFPKDITFTGKGFLRKHPARGTPQIRNIQDPEFLGFRRNNEILHIYTALHVAPGKPLHVALDASRYKTFTNKPFRANAISRKSRNGKPIHAHKAKPISAELEAYVAEKFDCAPKEIAWCTLDFEQRRGPSYVQFDIAGIGSIRRDILVLEQGKGLYLLPHRHRTAFGPNESAPIHIFFAKEFPGGEAILMAKPLSGKNRKPQQLGKIKLPANPDSGYDSRLLYMNTANLLPGQYDLRAKIGSDWQSQPCPITITLPTVTSPFTAYVHEWYGNIDNHELLQILENANIQFLANGPRLQSSMPRMHHDLPRRLSAGFATPPPPETISTPTFNDQLLDNLQRHRLAHIDFAPPRRDGMYNEGRSYHHSYQPNVERMIRRLHIFTQQNLDHPNAIGTTLAIDARHQGTRYGFGTPTDAHVAKRTQALADILEEQGHTPLNTEEYRFLLQNPRSPDSATRKKADAIRQRDLNWWHALAEESYQNHNPVYIRAIQEVRPSAKMLIFEEANFSNTHMPRETFANASIYYIEDEGNDIPMSAAFTTDWARAHAPDRPVWLSVGTEGTSEGQVKHLLHAFARGLQGGGIDFPPNEDIAELQRRARFMQFLTQYGAIAKHAKPDHPIAILATSAKQRYIRNGIFDYHAAYTILTRLGIPPAIIQERTLRKNDTPADLIVLVNEEHDLLADTRAKLLKLHDKGVKFIAIGVKPRDIPIDFHLEDKLPTIYDNREKPGFGPGSHRWLWNQFLERKTEFSKVLNNIGIQPRAKTDSERAYTLTLDDGPVRYVVVIADRARSHPGKFVREPKLPINLEGTWSIVRDLRLQHDLPTEIRNGRTHITVNLETEPCTLLALLPEEPHRIEQFRAPAMFHVHSPEGVLLLKHFGSTQDSLPSTPGKVTIQELLTGLIVTNTSFANLPEESVQTAPAVHIVTPLNTTPKLVLLEQGRNKLIPLAKNLAQKLEARFWQLQSDDFDEHPFRWYPRPQDTARLENIRKGILIGYRKSLNPFLDADKRHNPQLGGYRSLNPPFMVGQDCILFSGGELSESLREVSPWLDSPSSPGRGQARILNLYSPFFSGKNAVILVANDLNGFQKAAEQILNLPKVRVSTNAAKITPLPELASNKVLPRKPVSTPFQNYSAHRHSAGILTAPNGRTAILFSEENGTALVAPDGKTITAIKPLDHPVRILPDGTLWAIQTYGDEQGHVTFRKLDTNGKLLREFEVKDCHFKPEGAITAPTVSPDGRTAIVGRPGEILFINLKNGSISHYDDTPHISHRYSAFFPRVPVSTTFSSNGKHLLVTLDSRPPISGISQATFHPTFSATLLFDMENPTNPTWILDDGKSRKAPFAVHPGFAAVANNGTTAFAGYDGEVFVIDPAGKILTRHKVVEKQFGTTDRLGPIGGVATTISENGKLAAFAFRRKVLIWKNGGFQVIDFLQGIISASISTNGKRIHVSTDSGMVIALDPDGQETWNLALRPDVHLTNGQAGNLFAADGTGTLHIISPDGKILRKNNIWEGSLPLTRQIQRPSGFKRDSKATYYTEPNTLAIAKARLSAEQIKAWKPKGEARHHQGKTFHHLDGQITFETGDAQDAFLHFVYRKDNEDTPLAIEIEGNNRRIFQLDLPTPAYRIVNIPIREPDAKINIRLNRSVGIAECTLWSITWPGPNLAYQPPLATLLDPRGKIDKPTNLTDDLLGDDLLLDLQKKRPQDQQGSTTTIPAQKKLRIWWPNTDPLRTKGRFLTPQVDPRRMVDRHWFGISNNITPSWTNYYAPWGGSFTIDFDKNQKLSLVATYDRTTRQSKVNQGLQVFTGILRNEHDSPPQLGTALNNDQFWRLFPIEVSRKLKTLGIHAYSGRDPDGLSEIEIYP